MSISITRRTVVLTAAAGMFTVAATGASAAQIFQATLNSAQEVSPAGVTNSPLVGSATLELLDLGGGDFSLAYEIFLPAGFDYQFLAAGTPFDQIPDTADDLAVTRLHIHNAARGVNGPVVYGIYNPDQDFNDTVNIILNVDGSATVTGSWDPTDGNPVGNVNTFAAELLAAEPGEDVDLYFNLHSVADPAGVIRGQIQAVPAPLALVLFGFGAAALAMTAARKAA